MPPDKTILTTHIHTIVPIEGRCRERAALHLKRLGCSVGSLLVIGAKKEASEEAPFPWRVMSQSLQMKLGEIDVVVPRRALTRSVMVDCWHFLLVRILLR